MKTSIIQTIIGLSFLTMYACKDQLDVELAKQEPDPPVVEVAAPAELPIAIFSSACFREGEALTIYNPKTQDFKAYDGPDFLIKWFAGGEVVNQGTFIECVCGKKLTVEVKEVSTGYTNVMDYRTSDCRGE